jgi:hypothetical protein
MLFPKSGGESLEKVPLKSMKEVGHSLDAGDEEQLEQVFEHG